MQGDTRQRRSGLAAAIVSAALTTMVASKTGSPRSTRASPTQHLDPRTALQPARGRQPDLESGEDQDERRPADQRRHDRQLSTETAYCNIANRTGEGSSDFTWTEVQHNAMDWNQIWTMWMYPCALNLTRERGITPGGRISYTNIREIEKALDGGAMTDRPAHDGQRRGGEEPRADGLLPADRQAQVQPGTVADVVRERARRLPCRPSTTTSSSG